MVRRKNLPAATAAPKSASALLLAWRVIVDALDWMSMVLMPFLQGRDSQNLPRPSLEKDRSMSAKTLVMLDPRPLPMTGGLERALISPSRGDHRLQRQDRGPRTPTYELLPKRQVRGGWNVLRG